MLDLTLGDLHYPCPLILTNRLRWIHYHCYQYYKEMIGKKGNNSPEAAHSSVSGVSSLWPPVSEGDVLLTLSSLMWVTQECQISFTWNYLTIQVKPSDLRVVEGETNLRDYGSWLKLHKKRQNVHLSHLE